LKAFLASFRNHVTAQPHKATIQQGNQQHDSQHDSSSSDIQTGGSNAPVTTIAAAFARRREFDNVRYP